MNYSQLFRLDGKVALITGCRKGLGREIAKGLAEQGVSLVLSSRHHPEETIEEINKIGAPCISVTADISQELDVIDLSERSIAKFGKIDILINNAGISQLEYRPSQDASIQEWDRVMDVNLRGTFLCCKYIGKHMIEAGNGRIVNIASTAGMGAVPRAPAYCASKAGVLLMTKSLAIEWARYNVAVNAIAPHYLETELTQGLRASETIYNGLIKNIPFRRFGKVSEIVGPVLFLSSEAASYMTGSTVLVDGGYLAQ